MLSALKYKRFHGIFRRQLGDANPKSGCKKLKEVGRIHPETTCITLFKSTSSVFVWVLWHQTRHSAQLVHIEVLQQRFVKCQTRYPS